MFSIKRSERVLYPFSWPAVMMTDPKSQKGRALLLMGVVFGLTLVALGWFAWTLYSDSQYLHEGDVKVDRMEHLKGELKYLDEALTMSAMMSATTGDPSWEKRYQVLGPQLTRCLNELRQLATTSESAPIIARIGATNGKLVALERRTLKLVPVGRGSEAHAILTSKAYSDLKSEFSAAVTEFDRATDAVSESEEHRQHRALKISIIAISILVPILIASWWMMTLAVKQWEDTIEDRSRSLEMANQELQLAKELADDANTSKTWFLSRMSHELRTPLNAIIGFGQFLEESALDEQQKGDAAQINKCSRHLLDLINEILDISRLEVGSCSVSLEKVLVREVCEEVVSLMSPIASTKGVALELTVEGDLYAIADRRRLSQVLINLVSNAVKYNQEEGRAGIRVQSVPGRRLTFEVYDTGPGMSPEVLKKLFTPFERFGAHKRGIEGSGLGLVLSRALVHSMGGQIDVASKEGEGTRVQFNLVQHEDYAVAPTTSAVAQEPATSEERLAVLIEDNPLSAQLMTLVLSERPNLKILHAQRGNEGLELVRSQRPDVVFLDLHLPDVSGQFILAGLKSDPATNSIPVVMVTAESDAQCLETLQKGGAFYCLSKPISVPRVLDALDAALANVPERRIAV